MATISASLKRFDMMSSSFMKAANGATSFIAVSMGNMNMMQIKAEIIISGQQLNNQRSLPAPIIPEPAKSPDMPKWQGYDNIQIFNTSGAERMKQEMLSLNSMMRNIYRGKSALNSANMDFLPPNAQQDLNNAAQRIETLRKSIKQMEAQQRLAAPSMNIADTAKLNSGIEKLRGHMNKALQSQRALNNAMKQGDLSKVNNAYVEMMQNIDGCEKQIRDSAVQQDSANNSIESTPKSSNGLLGRVKGFVGAHLNFQSIQSGIEATIGGSMKLQQHLLNLQGLMGNKEVAGAFFDSITKRANSSAFNLEDYEGSAAKFMKYTKNTNNLDKLLNLNERLTFADPTQGFDGAGAAIKEAMGGNFSSLEENFNFGKADVEILKASKSMDEFIGKFDTLLNKKGLTNDLLAEHNKSGTAQFDNLKSNFETALANSGNNALNILTPVLGNLNQAFASGAFQPIFDGLSQGIAGAVKFVLWLGQAIQDNWGIIAPILIFITGVLLGIMIQQLWACIPPLIAQAIAWLGTYWPILLIVGAIMLFVTVLMHLGITSEQILGFVGGLFGVLFAAIYNSVAYVWNVFASLAEFLANLFIDPTYAINKLFYDLATNILKFIGKAAKGLQDLAEKIGFKFDLTSSIDYLISNMKEPTSDKNVVKIPRMEQLDYKDTAMLGAQKAIGLGNMLNGLDTKPKKPEMPDLDAWNKSQGPGKLSMGVDDANKSLKNIDDKIDVSNEHLEVLRDLAEQESIQNFVTLTPTVQVTTGDIREEADINKIISKIESYMENELVSSAEGVYA